MMIMLPLAVVAVSSFALGYGVRSLISAQRRLRRASAKHLKLSRSAPHFPAVSSLQSILIALRIPD